MHQEIVRSRDVTIDAARGVIRAVTGDDDELMRRVRGGDIAAFEILAERHYPVFLRFAWRQLGQREDAEEVVQDSLVRAFRAMRRGRLPDRFRPWLMRIVVNRCRSVVARRARRRRLFRLWLSRHETVVEPPPEVDGVIDPRLRTALASLTPSLREAFLLRHVEDLTYVEMSDMTGVRVSALKMRVSRAAEQLSRMLEEGG